MRLGDRLSPEDRRNYARRCLVPGRILHLHCGFTNPPKHKFVVLACVQPEPILFLINSRISLWLQARADLRDCQVTIHRDDHGFLAQDSFLDCTQAIRQIGVEQMENQLALDLSNIKEMITPREQEAIVYAVTASRTLTPREKRWITEALHPDD